MRKRPLCAICVLFIVIQSLRVLFSGVEDMKATALESLAAEGVRVRVDGTVHRIERKEKVTAFYLKENAVSAAGREITESDILVYFPIEENNIEIKTGNVLRVTGEAQAFDPARNPGNFDQRGYYRRQGIHVLVWAEQIEVLSGETRWLRHQLARLREEWDRLLVRHLGGYYGGTMSAILLGEKNGLDPEMKTMYQKCGISHLLAISGVQTLFLA